MNDGEYFAFKCQFISDIRPMSHEVIALILVIALQDLLKSTKFAS